MMLRGSTLGDQADTLWLQNTLGLNLVWLWWATSPMVVTYTSDMTKKFQFPR